MKKELAEETRKIWQEGLLSKEEILALALPGGRLSGLYFLIHKGEIVYVGRSDNVIGRVASHISAGDKDFDSFAYLPAGRIREGHYVHLFNPKHNKMWAKHD